MAATIRVGTASWTDHDPFYPPEYQKKTMQTQRLTYYARFFDLVEVDSTFYRLLSPRIFEGWVERVSAARAQSAAGAQGLWGDAAPASSPTHSRPDFIFDVKAFGELTWHHRDEQKQVIEPSAETFARFSEMIQPLRDAHMLGAVLFQFPPWFTFDEERLEYFQTVRELLPQDTIAVEFRHRSWVEGERLEQTRAALQGNHLAYCAVDEPQIGSGSVPPVVMLTDPHYAMVRFHGRNAKTWYGKHLNSSRDRFDYLYTSEELTPWVARIRQMADQLTGSEVHVIANNNGTTKVYFSRDEFGTSSDHASDLPPVRWPSVPQSEALLNALMLQHLLGQPMGMGASLPDTVDQAFLTAALSPDSSSGTEAP
jgi:uncharacterized protein YecE (DUF72 family)